MWTLMMVWTIGYGGVHVDRIPFDTADQCRAAATAQAEAKERNLGTSVDLKVYCVEMKGQRKEGV